MYFLYFLVTRESTQEYMGKQICDMMKQVLEMKMPSNYSEMSDHDCMSLDGGYIPKAIEPNGLPQTKIFESRENYENFFLIGESIHKVEAKYDKDGNNIGTKIVGTTSNLKWTKKGLGVTVALCSAVTLAEIIVGYECSKE